MAQKINLAVLNKKKEEIEKKEMHDVRGGKYCTCNPESFNDHSTDGFMESIEGCGCGSIFVVFGLAWG